MRLNELSACSLVPKVLWLSPEDRAGCCVLCLEWKVCEKIDIVDLTDGQADDLADGLLRLSVALQSATGVPTPDDDDPARQYEIVCAFVRRHPTTRFLLRPLQDIDPSDRQYGTHRTGTIHGDFHALNFGFENGRFSSVVDFDNLVKGLPCEDLAYAICEDMRRHDFRHDLRPSSKRRRVELCRRFMSRLPWPKEDWRFAVNHARLRMASRRLLKHPDNPFIALDVARRDRKLLPLLELMI